jgi:hypothetical protein
MREFSIVRQKTAYFALPKIAVFAAKTQREKGEGAKGTGS